MKKVFSLAMALIMLFALATTALAADVTINSDNNADAAYKAYQLMHLTTAVTCKEEHEHHEAAEDDESCYGYAYTVNEKYLAALKAVTGVETAAAGKTYDQTMVDALADYSGGARALADDLFDQIKTMEADASLIEGTAASLEQGYWLIIDDSALVNGEVRSLVMLDTAGQEEIAVTAKDDSVSVDKKVEGADTYVTASIGQEITYTLTSRLPADLAEYDAYTFKFVDNMDDGLDFVAITSAKIGGVNAVYTATGFFADDAAVKNGEGEIDFSDYVTENKAALGGKDVVVTYTTVVNANVEVEGDPENNDVKVVYTNDYKTNAEGETVIDEVDVYAFSFDVIKYAEVDGTDGYAEGDKLLSGAKFKLSTDEAGANVIDLVAGVDDTYLVCTAAEGCDHTHVTEITTDDAGKLFINGLAAGTYYLTETEAPVGYNLLAAPLTVVIEDTAADDADAPTVELPVVEVENNTGSELPSTGGVGTTIFTVVGGVMMAAAFILFITKKKMANGQ